MRKGTWVPWAAIAVTGFAMWLLLALFAASANAQTYPPSPPPHTTTTPPPSADTGFNDGRGMVAGGVLLGFGLAAAAASRRAKRFEDAA